jgi:undecaprenyl-diphosphatase
VWGDASVPLFPIILMAIVQGLGEFLPIGASGQLVLVPTLTGWPDQGLAVDLGAHLGTLVAVLLYFWRDVARMAAGLLRLLTGEVDEGARLALQVIIASVPGIGLGYLLQRYLGTDGTILVVALTGIGFGILLYAADRIGATFRRIEHMTIGRALIIGTAESLAFLPGAGRAGVAMMVGRLLGYERPDAARFAFLLSIPAVAAIAGAEAWRLTGEQVLANLDTALYAALAAGLSGLLAIAFLMAFLQRAGFGIFAVYRILFGALLLYLAYGRGL